MKNNITEKTKKDLIELAQYLREAKGLAEEADTLIFISENIESVGETLDDVKVFCNNNNIDYLIEVIHKYNIKTSLLIKSGYFRFLFDSSDKWLGHEVKIKNSLPPIPPE